jgi:sugar/nucleoside kinase (ribokinase family)
MTAEEWIERFAKELGVAVPNEEELARVLELASVAAHSSERRAAPIACWLAGASDRSVEELIEVAKRLGSPAEDQREC